MSDLPKKANVVVIGAGIVGNSLVYHLAKMGWKDIVQIDKGPLPNPGGSTGHASNFIFPVANSKEMTLLTQDSMQQFKDLGVFTESGGMEVARTEARMQEFKRRMHYAQVFNEPAELLTPEEAVKLVPFMEKDIILGAFNCPRVGVVDSLRAGTLMREYGIEQGALKVFANVEVTDLTVEKGHIRGVETNKGYIEAEMVVIACGVWAPRIAEMAGAFIPLYPAVHQMISVGPIPLFADSPGEIEYPIVRDMDTFMYERQNGNDLEVGSYAHRPILMHPDDIPSIEESKLSPTELPFTQEDFDPQMDQALELMPSVLDRDDVGIRHAINGLLSLTPDGYPVLGETHEVKGLWSANAVWIKEGPAVGKMLAEWMTNGYAEVDPHHSNIARYYEHGRTPAYVISRANESFNKTYGIVHPREQWEGSRNIRRSSFYPRSQELNAYFFQTAGWERPQWYESNAPLVEEYKDKILPKPNEWDNRWWSPIVQAEHLAMRDRVAMIDLSAFGIFDMKGPGALEYVQKMAMAEMDVKVGRAVYTPILAPNAGFLADLTIMRLADDEFRVVTGGGDMGRDFKWFTQNLPEDGSVQLHPQSSAFCTVGVWGPRARDLVQSVTSADMSHKGFRFATAKDIAIGEVNAWALRISYVGELGWEIYAPMEKGLALWDTLWEAGQEFGVVPAGIGVYGTTARTEKCYRLMGNELETEYNPVEAGLARPLKDADFIGKEAYKKILDEEPAAILCTMTVDDLNVSGEPRYMMGGEPIFNLDGEVLHDSHGRPSYVTTAATGASVGKHILMGYLPPEYAKVGTNLQVEYFGHHYPITVEVVGGGSLFDPDNERMKA